MSEVGENCKSVTHGLGLERSLKRLFAQLVSMLGNDLDDNIQQIKSEQEQLKESGVQLDLDLKVVDVDVSGRFLIPKDLLAFSALVKDIVLSSSVNMIEIWDKHRYELSISETLRDFDKLTEEVMGGRILDGSDEVS